MLKSFYWFSQYFHVSETIHIMILSKCLEIKRIFRNLICLILKLLLVNSNMIQNNKSLFATDFSNQRGNDKRKICSKGNALDERKCLRKFSMELGKLTIEQWSDNEVSFIYWGMNEKNCLLNTYL